MTTRHERAVQEARRHATGWDDLLARVVDDAGGGVLLHLYRDAFTRVPAALVSMVLLRVLLDDLVERVRREAETTIEAAVASGEAAAVRQIETFPRSARPSRFRPTLAALVTPAVLGIVAAVQAQRTAILALAASGRATAPAIIGTNRSPGLLSPTPVSLAFNEQVVATGQAIVAQAGRAMGSGYLLQAIAAIDERTTDCCLRVTGQAVPADGGMFHLTGEPRYADHMPGPPFHRWCRTATALIDEDELDDPLTRQLRAAGAEEIRQRKLARADRLLFSPPTHARTRRTRPR